VKETLGNKIMDLENFFLSKQKGGPSEEEVMEIKDSLIDKGELRKGASLSELVRYVREKQEKPKDISRGQAPRTRKEAENMAVGPSQRFKKAKGGYVKKYAKGGGVRKVRT